MSSNQLLTQISNQIATITINRPEIMNALSVEMFEELLSLLNELENDDEMLENYGVFNNSTILFSTKI